jgi:hypothetical protein
MKFYLLRLMEKQGRLGISAGLMKWPQKIADKSGQGMFCLAAVLRGDRKDFLSIFRFAR